MSHSSAGVAAAQGIGLAQLLVPSGKVSSDLTGFVMRINMADLPLLWWAGYDSGDISVYQNGTQIPVDIVWSDPVTRTGEMYVRTTVLAAASSTPFQVIARRGVDVVAANSTYGSQAVWASYDWVGSWYNDGLDRTSGGRNAVITGAVASEFAPPVTVSSNDHWQQGVAWAPDDGWWFSSATNELRRYSSLFVGEVTNDDPLGDFIGAVPAAAGVDHVGDIGWDPNTDLLVSIIEQYPNTPYDNQWVVRWNPDLTYHSSFNISAQGHEVSSINWNPADSCWDITSYAAPGEPGAALIYQYDDVFDFWRTRTLPVEIPYKQGITYVDGIGWYIMSGPHTGTSFLWRVADDLSSATKVWSGDSGMEGLESIGNDVFFANVQGLDKLQQLVYQGTSGEVGWLTLTGAGNAVVTGLPKRTAWTVGVSTKLAALPGGTNRTLLSYSANDSNNANRATLAARSTNVWTMWNSSDAFTNGPAIVAGDVGARKRLHHTQNTTVDRKLWLQGALVATDTGASQRPASTGDTLFIGAEDTTYDERFNGKLGGIIYLRNGVLDAAWLAAEQASWEATGFYSIL